MKTAHEIASTPELYNQVCLIRGNEWECMGYSKFDTSVKFQRLVPMKNGKLKVKTMYLNPNAKLITK